MNTMIILQSRPDSGRDNKLCRAYLDSVSWKHNPIGVSANSTNSAEVAAIRCAAKAFVKRVEIGGDPDEVETRIKLKLLERGRWRATLQPKTVKRPAREIQKVIITLADKSSGNVSCRIDFDPPVQSDAEATPATFLAIEMVEFLGKRITNVEVES